MSLVRAGAPGATRTCPHCRETILESSSICPACRHHLKFVPGQTTAGPPPKKSFPALAIEGKIRHPRDGEAWEYSIVVTVRDDSGAEISRHVAGVGAMRGTEQRSFTLAVEVFAPDAS